MKKQYSSAIKLSTVRPERRHVSPESKGEIIQSSFDFGPSPSTLRQAQGSGSGPTLRTNGGDRYFLMFTVLRGGVGLLATVIFCLGTSPSMALQTYPLVDHQKTELTISQTELNRIAVSNDRIQQVFGAEGLFDVQTDDEGGQIFLKLNTGFNMLSNSGLSKSMTVTLITEDGLTQDLKLVPKAVESQSILFKPSLHVEASTYAKASADKPLHNIFSLMKAMVRNEDVNGFTKTACEDSSAEALVKVEDSKVETFPSSALKTECMTVYLGEKLEGRRTTLLNQGKVPLSLKEEDFVRPGDLALTFSKSTIHPQEKITFYVISRRPQ